MKIIKSKKKIRLSNGNLSIREESLDGFIFWTFPNGHVYDDITSKALENEYQELIRKPVETTNEQPIEFSKLSKIKQNLLLTCYHAICFIDDSKVRPLEINIEEECAVTARGLIEIRKGSIDFGVKVNGINVIDKNIEW